MPLRDGFRKIFKAFDVPWGQWQRNSGILSFIALIVYPEIT
jgi:hypothetical protein